MGFFPWGLLWICCDFAGCVNLPWWLLWFFPWVQQWLIPVMVGCAVDDFLVVEFEWWLCWVLGLFMVVREMLRKRGGEEERQKFESGEMLFWVIYFRRKHHLDPYILGSWSIWSLYFSSSQFGLYYF